MVGDGRLAEPDLLHDLTDGKPAAAALAHNALAGFIGNGFGEQNRIEFHLHTEII